MFTESFLREPQKNIYKKIRVQLAESFQFLCYKLKEETRKVIIYWVHRRDTVNKNANLLWSEMM